jgi:D-3-phosphoglycerate dehydrogenase
VSRFTVAHLDALSEEFSVEEEELGKADAKLLVKSCQNDDEAIGLARDADGILCTFYPTGRSIFEACPNVRVVGRYGVGFDNVDVEAATEHNVVVANVPDYCADEVANHAMALLLACNRKLFPHDRGLRVDEREQLPPVGQLRGETLGLVAFGNIARAVTVRAKAFGLNVIAYDPYIDPAPAAELGVRLVTLQEVMSEADYVSVHTPLNEETCGMIGLAELALMKPTAYIVNTARGGIISESALIDALENGAIAGAGIDVWEDERNLDSEYPLLHCDNVIGTPHVAYYSDQSLQTLRSRTAEAVADVLLGFLPRHVVNQDVLEKVDLKPRPDR